MTKGVKEMLTIRKYEAVVNESPKHLNWLELEKHIAKGDKVFVRIPVTRAVKLRMLHAQYGAQL